MAGASIEPRALQNKKTWSSPESRASIVYKGTTYRAVVTSPLKELRCKP
ncbi:hypothetical protein GCM10010467_03920 [Actinocorallia glomerata]|uniref:Uncharacterized protein n=2 Tax=Actinomycetes TaxID=1760 RepID=A0ABP6M3L5_9MICC